METTRTLTIESPNGIPPPVIAAGIPILHQPLPAAVERLLKDRWMSDSGDNFNSPAKLEHRSDSVGPFDVVRHHDRRPSELKELGIHLLDEKQAPWSEKWQMIIMGPYEYIESIPGKDVRGQLIAGFNAWLRVPDESLKIITKVIAMLHTASLLIDDIEDSSLLRRGVPVAHSVFGAAQTINTANYVYFCALQELARLRNPLTVEIYTEELLNLHRGQGLDLYWRDSLICPTAEEYVYMVNNKTGGLFRLAIKLMQAESSVEVDCIPLVNTIGLLFQILDDYKNLSSSTYTLNKGLAEDLTEGKFSFPVIHAIRADPRNHVILNVLKQKTTNVEIKKYAIHYMDRIGSFKRTRDVLRDLTERALALVDAMDEAQGGRARANGIRLILENLKVDGAADMV